MRVAIIVVAVSLASVPALASPSCMTQSEARQKFPNAHLWWHGPNRCWDATPSRARLAQRSKTRETRKAEREADAEPVEEKKPPQLASATKWREAMSKASPEDIAGVTARAQAQAEVVLAPLRSEPPAAPRVDWRERWVEITQRVPPIVDKSGPADLAADAGAADPIVTPARVMLALLVLMLAFGAFELAFRRPSRRAD